MAILGTSQKQPREVLDVDVNYTTVLAGRSDTIVSQTTEVAPAGLTILSVVRTGNVVKLTLGSGTADVLYKVTILATSSAGLVYEDEFNILVTEV